MALRGTPQALKVLGKLSVLQPQPTRCSSCVWVTRGHLPALPPHTCGRGRAACGAGHPSLLPHAGREPNGPEPGAERPPQPHQLGCTARQCEGKVLSLVPVLATDALRVAPWVSRPICCRGVALGPD